MIDLYQPFGPYYLTLYCENKDAAEIVSAVFVDGLESEADAWAACNAITDKTVDAIDETGEAVLIAGDMIVQIAITKAVGADFPQSFAA